MTPLEMLENWYQEAINASELQADAMSLATATPAGKPSVRIVLYKGQVDGGLSFVTNYNSRKGSELVQNPQASLCFFWPKLHRQIRVEGIMQMMSEQASDAYFKTRPRGSQIGAWVSNQSSEIPSYEYLAKEFQKKESEFLNREVSRPKNWGGFVLIPESIEFWIGKESRLHDRFIYIKNGTNWLKKQLAP